jgi:hypothetical protein
MEITDHACFHCGEPIPEGISLSVERDGQQKPVCCSGCQAVAELIFNTGLGRYYQFRQDLGRKAEEDLQSEIQAWQGCDERGRSGARSWTKAGATSCCRPKAYAVPRAPG